MSTPLPNDDTAAPVAEPQAEPRIFSQARINSIIRLWLLVVIVTAFAITLLAARPGYRYFGIYPAAFNVRNVIQGDGGAAAAYVTVSNASIVTFPSAWKIGSEICMALRVERTDLPAQITFNEYEPQIHWDDQPGAAFVIDFNSLIGASSDKSAMRLMNDDIGGLISEHTSYQVHWFAQDPTPIYPNQAAGGLTCVRFQFSDDIAHLPPFFHISVSVQNVHVESKPAYYFSYHDDLSPQSHPPQTLELQTMTIDDYLATVSRDAPFAVQSKTATQADQLATETASQLR